MTENKRFTIKGKWSKSLNRLHGLILDNNEDMYVTDVVYLLNKFLEENEELKEERDYFERKKCEYFNKYNKKHLDNIQLKEENEELKQAYAQLKHKHSLLHDECIDAECDRDRYRKDIVSLEKENEELKQTIKSICKDYENHHGMDIRNAEWFTAW